VTTIERLVEGGFGLKPQQKRDILLQQRGPFLEA
jgi:hypothetical protein